MLRHRARSSCYRPTGTVTPMGEDAARYRQPDWRMVAHGPATSPPSDVSTYQFSQVTLDHLLRAMITGSTLRTALPGSCRVATRAPSATVALPGNLLDGRVCPWFHFN